MKGLVIKELDVAVSGINGKKVVKAMHSKVLIKGIDCKKTHVIDNVPEILTNESSLPHSFNVTRYPHLSDVHISKSDRDGCNMSSI